MTDVPQGVDWWKASDGRWYPPELRSATSNDPPGAASEPPVADGEQANAADAAPGPPGVPTSPAAVAARAAETAPADEDAAQESPPKRPGAAKRRSELAPTEDDSEPRLAEPAGAMVAEPPSGAAGLSPAAAAAAAAALEAEQRAEEAPAARLLTELRGSALTSDIDRIGDRLEIYEEGVQQRGRGNKDRGRVAMRNIAVVEVEKTHKGFWLRITATDGRVIVQQGLEQKAAESAAEMIRERAPLAAQAEEEAARAVEERAAAERASAEAAAARAAQPAPASNPVDVTEQIRKVAELRDQGILTEAEFQAKKQELLDRI